MLFICKFYMNKWLFNGVTLDSEFINLAFLMLHSTAFVENEQIFICYTCRQLFLLKKRKEKGGLNHAMNHSWRSYCLYLDKQAIVLVVDGYWYSLLLIVNAYHFIFYSFQVGFMCYYGTYQLSILSILQLDSCVSMVQNSLFFFF